MSVSFRGVNLAVLRCHPTTNSTLAYSNRHIPTKSPFSITTPELILAAAIMVYEQVKKVPLKGAFSCYW